MYTIYKNLQHDHLQRKTSCMGKISPKEQHSYLIETIQHLNDSKTTTTCDKLYKAKNKWWKRIAYLHDNLWCVLIQIYPIFMTIKFNTNRAPYLIIKLSAIISLENEFKSKIFNIYKQKNVYMHLLRMSKRNGTTHVGNSLKSKITRASIKHHINHDYQLFYCILL